MASFISALKMPIGRPGLFSSHLSSRCTASVVKVRKLKAERVSWRCVPGCNISLRYFLDQMCLGRFVPWTMRPLLYRDRDHVAMDIVYFYSPPTVRKQAYSSIWIKRTCLSESGLKYFVESKAFTFRRQDKAKSGAPLFALAYHMRYVFRPNFSCQLCLHFRS